MSRAPLYRIQTVAEMTGVPASTLRAWERRYGIPTPQRTASSYRLYGERELDQVRRLRDLCAGGLAPSEAAQMVLDGAPERPPVADEPSGGTPFDEAVQRILCSVEEFDPVRLRTEVARASYLGNGATVFESVLRPAMTSIGQRWHEGTLSVAHEHMASEVLLGAARDFFRLLQPESGDRLAVLACFAGEHHVLALYGVACRLAQWGFRCEVLGADTPPEAVASAVAALDPQLVGLSVTVGPSEHAAPALLDAYAAAMGQTPWVVGGAASERLRRGVEARGGLCAGADLTNIRAQLEASMRARQGREQS